MGQFSCPSTAGGGCCDVGLLCTHLGTSPVCRSATGAPGSGSGGGVISTGAKAGVGVGIGLGAMLLASIIAFIVSRRRPKDILPVPTYSGPVMPQMSPTVGYQSGVPEPQVDPYSEAANAATRRYDLNPDGPEDIRRPVEICAYTRGPEGRLELPG